jgi:MarR family transcriptional regulator for hemolysin
MSSETGHSVFDAKQGLGFALRDASRRYTKLFETRAAAAFGLTLMQCRALVLLSQNEGITQRQLAQLIEADAMSLVRIIDRMEAQGWVRRLKTSADRRARRLSVTATATPLLQQIHSLVVEVRKEAFRGFSDPECTQFLDLLQRMHGNLTRLSNPPEAS